MNENSKLGKNEEVKSRRRIYSFLSPVVCVSLFVLLSPKIGVLAMAWTPIGDQTHYLDSLLNWQRFEERGGAVVFFILTTGIMVVWLMLLELTNSGHGRRGALLYLLCVVVGIFGIHSYAYPNFKVSYRNWFIDNVLEDVEEFHVSHEITFIENRPSMRRVSFKTYEGVAITDTIGAKLVEGSSGKVTYYVYGPNGAFMGYHFKEDKTK